MSQSSDELSQKGLKKNIFIFRKRKKFQKGTLSIDKIIINHNFLLHQTLFKNTFFLKKKT